MTDLAEHIEIVVRQAQAETLAVWRAWANESGIRAAKASLPDAIDGYEAALRQKREADETVRVVKAAHSDAVSDAEYELEICWEKKGASWQLVRTDPACELLAEPRPMTADARRDWTARTAAAYPQVQALAASLREAEWEQATASDGVKVAEARLSAAKYSLAASTAMLTTLAQAMPKGD